MKVEVSENDKNKCGPCNFRVGVVLFGGFFIHLALGAMYTIGNFSPYYISYIRNRTADTEVKNVDTLWINGAGTVGNCVGLTVGGIFAHRFGARIATFIGSLVFCGSVAVNYFSVNSSFIAIVITSGLTTYLGHKLTYGSPVQTAIKWLPEYSTLAAGLVVSGTGGGSLIFNQVITGYINPDNLSPDLVTEDGGRYFTQPDLLDRVPTCFLLLGGAYFCMQLIGIACLSEPPPRPSKVVSLDVEKQLQNKQDEICPRTKENNDDTTNQYAENGSKPAYDNLGFSHKENEYKINNKNANTETATVGDNMQENKDAEVSNESDSFLEELGILEAIKFALRCRSFYIVWLTMMLMNGGMQFINSLYKAYGQTFIDDDHFLALVGSLAAIFNCIGRPIWGAVMDKFGFRVAIRCVSSGFVILLATLLLTEHLSKYLFMLWICALYFFFCGIWSIMPSTLAKLLGPQHMAINYGIIYTGLSVVSILGSLFGTSLKAEIGWHGLFFMAAGLGAVVFLLSFVFNGIDRNGKRI
ncbi:uncharacterized protein LOC123561696 [Mercenaria mercenaria]|uniref:uncharacterized protein LOC123561696 n=1 Tax=Mercenaria mercenaria TaxID=6596 RepID=UPI00234F88AB|nr:uncharacterized protein LOC123561696 [Mercenaria mercenaria]XP_053380320.1 uncharacterized protein LOC123561696 [Mercenaria mercenaria]